MYYKVDFIPFINYKTRKKNLLFFMLFLINLLKYLMFTDFMEVRF